MDTSVDIDAVDLRSRATELAAVGRLAPSLHNAQPWAFRVGRDRVDVLLDSDRLLPVADPASRQAHLGVGAAVLALRLALRGADLDVRVRPWPDPDEPGLVARIAVTGRRSASEEDRRLLSAVPARRTVRSPSCWSPDHPAHTTPLHEPLVRQAPSRTAQGRWSRAQLGCM